MVRQLHRDLLFASAISPRQIARRISLKIRRAGERRLKPKLDRGSSPVAPVPPLPVFAPRRGSISTNPYQFRFLGRPVAMGRSIDWHAPGPGPRDQLWRMNLHYMEYLEDVPDDDFVQMIDSWIEANPPYRRGSTSDAWNAYALSLRTVVWMQQLALRRERLSSDFLGRSTQSVASQMIYLERHLETDIGGNHLVKNIKALAWGSMFFQGRAAERWGKRATELLSQELARQILLDGMHFELSPSYHCQVFADLVEIRHALSQDPLSGRLDDALRRSAQAVADLAHPDGMVAQFGDAGLHMAYPPSECLGAYRSIGGEVPKPRARFVFEQAGYYGCREADFYLLADAGQIAPPSLPAHGHGDMFSFELSLAGERFIVDQGVFEYVAGPLRRQSRTVRNHNSVSIEGGDQAIFFGAFRSARRAKPELLAYREVGSGFELEARHDGFRGIAGRPRHRRNLHAAPGRLIIRDALEGSSPATARSALLLAPSIRAERLSDFQLRLQGSQAAAILTFSHQCSVEPATWWPDMGVERATSRVVMNFPGEEEGRIELVRAPEDARVEV